MSPTKVDAVRFDEFYNVIDNKNRTSKAKHQGTNPSTGEKLWDVPVGTQQDVDDAVISAQKAFETFRYTPVEERKEYLKKFKEAWLSYADELTDLMCAETGKPRQFAAYEVKAAAAFFDWHINLDMPVDRLEDAAKIVTTRYTPLGVIGAICPWNFPILLSIGKVIPSILTGNAIIVKPSPFTPYTALKMAEIGATVLPAGVFQVIGGDDMLGPMLTAHPGIAKISFTGSIATGKKIMSACAQTLKRVTLELGGNDAAIILPDVDVKKIAPELVMGAFQNSGQVCVATKRIYIHQDIYDEFLAEMVTATKNLKIGSPDSGSIIGPVQNYMQYQRVKEFFADSKTQGYKFAVGDSEAPDSSNGFFLKPTIIDNPPNDSRIIQEEPFGPIVPTQPWSDEAEVIKRANNTNAGLGACVWGKDIERAEAIAAKLEAGSVFINSFERPTPQAYFSGHKESGIGGEWGKDGIKAYCNAHVTHLYKNKA
ncbi:aldehyde dehydrogenase-like protein [Polychaeton citri CBS 116435]|uniref:aldehyde dehydrogenase (NAD(+)) n=1 Tax=Polychaeton citri CBS 116435 TaxID=1314669 RepID=A0A9P4Q5A1_9PEZI|nr:aldehyde dehydrogenase-like protein [Polychaeton citri CBS 116435]